MVLQSELIDELIIPYMTGLTYSMDMGNSAGTVSYTDNDLDTVHFNSTATTTTTEANEVTVTALMTSAEGNGDDFDSALLKTADGAIDKVLFTEFTKDANTQVQIVIKTTYYVE
jgi:hypothetical protein